MTSMINSAINAIGGSISHVAQGALTTASATVSNLIAAHPDSGMPPGLSDALSTLLPKAGGFNPGQAGGLPTPFSQGGILPQIRDNPTGQLQNVSINLGPASASVSGPGNQNASDVSKALAAQQAQQAMQAEAAAQGKLGKLKAGSSVSDFAAGKRKLISTVGDVGIDTPGRGGVSKGGGGSAGTGATPGTGGLPDAGSYMGNMVSQMQDNLAFQQQMSAIQEAFAKASSIVKADHDMAMQMIQASH